MNSLIKIQGKVQHYDWGGNSFIPNFLNLENSSHKPFAEYWLGNHPAGQFTILSGNDLKINTPFPFLFKILDVEKMLSIQAHPSKTIAIHGFEMEEKNQIPIDSPLRVFKDKNHKPELMVAMSDFWLLHGFVGLSKFLETIQFFDIEIFNEATDIKEAFEILINLPDPIIEKNLTLLKNKLNIEKTENPMTHNYWIKKAIEWYPNDRGLFMIPMLNLVYLQKGEAIFQDSGIPHAYLKGINLEIMSNSDNVFRGGLTNKHVDVDLLKKHLLFDEIHPKIIQKQFLSESEYYYPTPCDDFQLNFLKLQSNEIYPINTGKGAHIFLVIEGNFEIDNDQFIQGQSFLLMDENKLKIQTNSECLIALAFTPKKEMEAN